MKVVEADRNRDFYETGAAKPGASVTIKGTVKFFNVSKGFGFIVPDDGGPDAYVHAHAIGSAGLLTLREGQKISYDLRRNDDGKESAINLRALSSR